MRPDAIARRRDDLARKLDALQALNEGKPFPVMRVLIDLFLRDCTTCPSRFVCFWEVLHQIFPDLTVDTFEQGAQAVAMHLLNCPRQTERFVWRLRYATDENKAAAAEEVIPSNKTQ